MNRQKPMKPVTLFSYCWPNRPPAEARLTVKKLSILSQLLLVFLAPICLAEADNITTEKIIQQAELLFKGKVISVSPTADPNFYQIRLLQSSAKIILIRADKKNGEMLEIKTPDNQTNAQ